MNVRTLGFLSVILGTLSIADPAFSCSLGRAPSPVEMVIGADVIVRATAIEYAVVSGTTINGREVRTTGVPDARIRFRVESVVKGTYRAPDLVLPGYLSDQDDWNDQAVPYSMVRRNGRSGSCFANTYRKGAQFLLVMKRTGSVSSVFSSDTEYTVNWYALGPVNEQLRSSEDPWMQWVRDQVKAQ